MNTNEIKLLNRIGGTKLRESGFWHLLELINDGNDRDDCQLCHQSRLGPTYECKESGCGFLLHKSCVEQPCSQDVEHEHDLNEINHMIFIKELENEDKNVCFLCEKPVSGSAFKCSFLSCNFLLHQLCADIPCYLDDHPADSHRLWLKGPLEDMHCDLCSKLCIYSYRCHDLCKFSIHVNCASRCLINFADCNPHKFIIIHKNVDQLTCQACGKQMDKLAYLCKYCRLMIHQICAQTYKRNIRTKECGHSLSCTFSLPPTEYKCKVCNDSVDKRYAAYICDICEYAAHLWCAYAILYSIEDETEMLQEIQNHINQPEHKFILSYEEPTQDQLCTVCKDHIISPPFYSCAPCKFFLHERCGTLPKKIKPFFDDRRTLVLEPKTSSSRECAYCSRNGFDFVYSYVSWFLDIKCGLLQKDLKHEGHQHRLFFGTYDIQNCNACNEEGTRLFRCHFCIFNLCPTCVTYPLHTWHRDHEHLLNLTYKIEDDFEEYYCLICEKERDPSDWFYSCQDCNFVAHLKCVYPMERPVLQCKLPLSK